MIRINQIKMPRSHTERELLEQTAAMLRVDASAIRSMTIVRKSMDARKKPDLKWVYMVDVSVKDEKKILKKIRNKDISIAPDTGYHFPAAGTEELKCRPVIVGSGPCGLFCAYLLALNGYRPVVIERGKEASRRKVDVERFWETGELQDDSNVQFGEGGAGTFSDGKLNTLVKDNAGRNYYVRRTFVELGADEEVLYQQHPHLGTDQLISIVEKLRKRIIDLGGAFYFDTKLTDLEILDGHIVSVELNGKERIPVEVLVLAIGHSARDTYRMLYDREISMQPKPFAIGCRVEHPQALINLNQYGEAYPEDLSAAEYKVTATPENGRGVYSFCMCPGGFVVNASSEQGRLAVNGMSNRDRGERNANSAIVITVRPEDFLAFADEDTPECLSGMKMQRTLEERAYLAGKGKIPIQLFGDYKANRLSTKLGSIAPNVKGQWSFGDVRSILPEELAETFVQGMKLFEGKIRGFAADDVLIEGLESRTSSPLRIVRDEQMESCVRGIYPAGEGAGYAGGIMSAAIDGMKIAEAIAAKYSFENIKEAFSIQGERPDDIIN